MVVSLILKQQIPTTFKFKIRSNFRHRMKKVYFINGICCDERTFSFLDLSFCQPQFVQWLPSLPKETLAQYAERLFAAIDDDEAILVGLSFGGMIATEIAKRHPGVKAILLSSAKTSAEIPPILKFWRYIPFYELFGDLLIKNSAAIVIKITGIKGKEQKQVQREILKTTNGEFTRWAIHVIVNWKNNVVPPNITHIHGTTDKILPVKNVKADHVIYNGEHLMVMNEVEKIGSLLRKLIV